MTGPAVVGGKAAGSRAELERNSEASPLILEDGRGVTRRPEGWRSEQACPGLSSISSTDVLSPSLGNGRAAGPGRAGSACRVRVSLEDP